MRKVFWEVLPQCKTNRIDWNKSIGEKVNFIYDNTEGTIIIKNYSYSNGHGKVTIEYCRNEYYITPEALKNARLAKILKKKQKKPFSYKYDIGEKISYENKGFIILSRRYEYTENNKLKKYYKCKCLICNYISEKEEGLVEHLCCDACGIKSKKVIAGYNDIPTTNPWMVDYFQGGYDEAKLYRANSNMKMYMKCPYCNKVSNRELSPNQIYTNGGMWCSCLDGISYPNKFSYALLSQLCVENVIHEYSPDWAKLYKYDNYFEYNGEKYILEMDGNLGHGNTKWGNVKDIEGKIRDNKKDELAKQNDIEVIRIDCKKSKFIYIKNNIINSKLSELFDLSYIDWDECNKQATKNIVYEVCNYHKDNPDISPPNIAKLFKIAHITVINYLKKGVELGWCKYNKTQYMKKKENI